MGVDYERRDKRENTKYIKNNGSQEQLIPREKRLVTPSPDTSIKYEISETVNIYFLE